LNADFRATMRVQRIFFARAPNARGENSRGAEKIPRRRLFSEIDVAMIPLPLRSALAGEARPGKSGRMESQGERMASVVTKSDLVHAAARAGNLSKLAAGEAVNAVFDAIVANVARGKRVTVVGFGTFMPRKRKARAGRSPANGKEIRINAKTVPAFCAGQGFKDRVGER